MPDRPRFDGPDGELLGRYLAGECSEAEIAAVRHYLMAHPDAAGALEQFVQHLDGAASRPAAPDAAASWAEVRGRLRDADRDLDGNVGARGASRGADAPGRARDSGRRRAFAALPATSRAASWWRWAAGAGAAAAALLAVASVERAQRAASAAHASPRVYETAVGQRAELRLADGTRVRIAPASRLRVATDFGTERRDVYLVGEAYFDVAHDAGRPFTVYVGGASARDIGTAFAARGYAEDDAVQVVVREGEVAMSGVGRLGAGDLGRLAAEGKASVRRHVNVDALLGWVDGRLGFEDAPLGQVLQDLRRWHGTDVRLAEPGLAALPFTGSLAGLPSDAAVDVVAATLGLRVRRDGARVVLATVAGRTPASSAARRAAPHSPTAVP